MGLKVTGLKELERKFNNIPAKTMKGCEEAIKFVYKQSQPQIPVDTGALKKSGKVTRITDGYELTYHSESKEGYNYAPIQHENTKFHHKVGNAKYVEKPVSQNMSKLKSIVVGEVMK